MNYNTLSIKAIDIICSSTDIIVDINNGHITAMYIEGGNDNE